VSWNRDTLAAVADCARREAVIDDLSIHVSSAVTALALAMGVDAATALGFVARSQFVNLRLA
jgi:hypothetical protein